MERNPQQEITLSEPKPLKLSSHPLETSLIALFITRLCNSTQNPDKKIGLSVIVSLLDKNSCAEGCTPLVSFSAALKKCNLIPGPCRTPYAPGRTGSVFRGAHRIFDDKTHNLGSPSQSEERRCHRCCCHRGNKFMSRAMRLLLLSLRCCCWMACRTAALCQCDVCA
jgi:hypothetical protein